jgi:hypothetical protein
MLSAMRALASRLGGTAQPGPKIFSAAYVDGHSWTFTASCTEQGDHPVRATTRLPVISPRAMTRNKLSETFPILFSSNVAML